MTSHAFYIPCNRPAVCMIQMRSEGPYRMCEMCADHNVRNRGGTDVGPYEGEPMASQAPTPDDLAQYAADATESVNTDNILSRITLATRELREARDEVTAAEEALKLRQQRVRTLEEYTLPELMREAGQEKLRTADGFDVELVETLRASIPPTNLPSALEWLINHNQSAIIKRDIRLQFGKNEEDRADRVLAIILEAGYTPTDKQSVHPQTLAAVIRELVAEGVDVPMELLGAHVQAGVKVKEAKR